MAGLKLKLVSAVAASGLATACTTLTLPLQAEVQGSGEHLKGSATGHMDGAGELNLASDLGAQCHGQFVYVTPREGRGTLSCTDGRTGSFTFASTGSRGTGSGELEKAPFTFTFGR